MVHEITVIKLGPPAVLVKTIQDGNTFICPNPKCGNQIQIKMVKGISGTLYPDCPLICSKCKSEYGIAKDPKANNVR